jgi:hypothetical protein
LVEHATRLPEQHGTRLRQRHAALGAVEEPDSKLLLQFPYLLADRRLRDVQALSGTAEMQLLRDRYEISQMPKFHPSPFVSWLRRSVRDDATRRI